MEFVLSGCCEGAESVDVTLAGVWKLLSISAKPSVLPRCYRVTTAAMGGLPGDHQKKQLRKALGLKV